MERLLDMANPVVQQAQLAFEYSLKHMLWKQCVFFAERLVAECVCDESAYLLALAHFHGQEHGRACWYLKGNRLPEARYLLARCCFILQRWDEAEDALACGTPNAPPSGLSEVVNGAAGLFLLGQVKEKQSKREQAIDCYAKCLEVCPFMWEAYERWSWLILALPCPSWSSSPLALASMAVSTFSDEKFAQAAASLQAEKEGRRDGQALREPVQVSLGTRSQPPVNERTFSAPGGFAGGGASQNAPSQNAPPRNSDHIHKDLPHGAAARKE